MTVVFPRPQGNLIILKLDFPSSPQTDKLLFRFLSSYFLYSDARNQIFKILAA